MTTGIWLVSCLLHFIGISLATQKLSGLGEESGRTVMCLLCMCSCMFHDHTVQFLLTVTVDTVLRCQKAWDGHQSDSVSDQLNVKIGLWLRSSWWSLQYPSSQLQDRGPLTLVPYDERQSTFSSPLCSLQFCCSYDVLAATKSSKSCWACHDCDDFLCWQRLCTGVLKHMHGPVWGMEFREGDKAFFYQKHDRNTFLIVGIYKGPDSDVVYQKAVDGSEERFQHVKMLVLRARVIPFTCQDSMYPSFLVLYNNYEAALAMHLTSSMTKER